MLAGVIGPRQLANVQGDQRFRAAPRLDPTVPPGACSRDPTRLVIGISREKL